MKKKENTALAEAFRKLSTAAAEIADALDSTDKKSEVTEVPAKETTTETTAKPAAKSEKEETAAHASNISFEDVRTILAAKAGKGFRAEVKEILGKHGASCLSDLEAHPEDFATIMKEAEAIGNE